MKTVCLDFDGVLHGYSRGWADGTIYDPPIPGAVEAVRELATVYRLVISTCREDHDAVAAWVLEHFDLRIPVTGEKPIASVYIDDRAIRFEGEWGPVLEQTHELMAGTRAISGPGAGKGGGG